MSAEFDYDLTSDQWEALKALRLPDSRTPRPNRFIVDRLIALQLAAITNDGPVLTEQGRKALVRGSITIVDVAA